MLVGARVGTAGEGKQPLAAFKQMEQFVKNCILISEMQRTLNVRIQTQMPSLDSLLGASHRAFDSTPPHHLRSFDPRSQSQLHPELCVQAQSIFNHP